MPRFGGIPNTRQFRNLIREEALPSPRLAKAPTLPIAPMAPVSMAKFPTNRLGEQLPSLPVSEEEMLKKTAMFNKAFKSGDVPVPIALNRAPIAPNAVAQSAMANLPVEMQTILMPDTVSPIAQSGISEMDTDMDKEIEKILAAAMAPPSQETVNADIAKLMGMEPQVSVDTVDPVQAAVDAAVGNGQPTMDNTVLAAQPVTQAQPDFMTQLNDLIAQMQLEQTAAAEQQQQQEQQRQEQTAEMTKNYMIGQPAVGYNPYQSGQYQNNPYGAAGVPNMGGITSIPVPAPYQAPRTMT